MTSLPDNYQQALAQHDVRIRHVTLSDRYGMQQIGALHMKLLSAWGPMTALGERFVREACYGVNMRDGLLQTDLLMIDGQAAGFVAYTSQSMNFHRNSISAHWPRVLGELAWALISNPTRIVGLVGALGVILSRRTEKKEQPELLGEIVCIGVHPDFLAAKFIRKTGVRASELLIRHAADYMHKMGVKQMRMLVDKPNKAALFLYHKLGAGFSEFSQAGAPMVEVVFELTETFPDCNSEIPEIWQPVEPVNSGKQGSGWRLYWERVADNEKIFRHEADDYFDRFLRNVDLAANGRILDFGCGYGFIAEMFAIRGYPVALWDASSNARRKSLFRMAPYKNVQYLDLSENTGFEKRYAESFDLITVHSVIQYMSGTDFKLWLDNWHKMLAPGGRLILSDIITPASKTLAELRSLLGLSIKKRFFIGALWECLRETPNYWRMRNDLSLTISEQEQIAKSAKAAGYDVSMLVENLSHRQARLTLILQKPA